MDALLCQTTDNLKDTTAKLEIEQACVLELEGQLSALSLECGKGSSVAAENCRLQALVAEMEVQHAKELEEQLKNTKIPRPSLNAFQPVCKHTDHEAKHAQELALEKARVYELQEQRLAVEDKCRQELLYWSNPSMTWLC